MHMNNSGTFLNAPNSNGGIFVRAAMNEMIMPINQLEEMLRHEKMLLAEEQAHHSALREQLEENERRIAMRRLSIAKKQKLAEEESSRLQSELTDANFNKTKPAKKGKGMLSSVASSVASSLGLKRKKNGGSGKGGGEEYQHQT